MTTMADLMASLDKKRLKFERGEEIEGEIVNITPSEIILDLGTKTEGVISTKDLIEESVNSLKIGQKLKAYVISPEGQSGQIILSIYSQQSSGKRTSQQSKKWSQLNQSLQAEARVSGRVIELNKGGVVVDLEGVRGFIPFTQLTSEIGDLNEAIGKRLNLKVLEVDEGKNRVVLSLKKEVSNEILEKLDNYKRDQKVEVETKVVTPAGLLVEVDGIEGWVRSSDTSWEQPEDLNSIFKVGQKLEAVVLGADKESGRLNLSLKSLEEDPFTKVSENFQVDDVVTGTIIEKEEGKWRVDLGEGVQGEVKGEDYSAEQKTNFLVTGVDTKKRVVNLAPFVTSTVGLIYK